MNVTASTGFLSLVMEAAGQGLGVREALQDILGRVSPEMFQGEERRYAESARKLLDLRQMPTAFAIAKDCGAAPMDLAQLKLAGAGLYADLAAATEGVRSEYQQRILQEGLNSTRRILQKGDLAGAQSAVLKLAELVLTGGENDDLINYDEYDPNQPSPPRPITTTLRALNEDLGGGFGAGGSLCMSLVAAPSGVGKSTFAFQQVGHWLLKEGHWVLYCSGEMEASYVFEHVTRIVAQQGEETRKLRIPKHLGLFSRAHEQLQEAAKGGRFTVLDDNVTPERVLSVARQKVRELRKVQEAGSAPETVRLIVVVDNWDNLFTDYDFGHLREDQVFGRWMQRFQRQAAEYGYHHMNLAQTNGEAESAKEPAHAHEMQGSRKLHSKASHVITLYRSRDAGAVERALRDGGELPSWARPQIAVRKARGGGRTGARFYKTDSKVGDWQDTDVFPEF